MAVKQQIPTYTNTNKSLTFGNFKGIDASSSPFEVNTSRATYCQNLINENGVNHKRQGWKTVFPISQLGEIKGVFPVIFNNHNYLIIIKKYSQATIPFDGTYWMDIKLYSYTEDDFSNAEEHLSIYVSSIDFDKCYCFIKKGKAYLKWIGGFVVVDENSIDNVSSNSFVPTTTISINSDKEETATRQSYQSVNLFSKRRKNTLIGCNSSDLTISIVANTTNPPEKDFEITLTDTNNQSFTYNCSETIPVKCTTYEYVVVCVNEDSAFKDTEKTGTITISPYDTINGTTSISVNVSSSSSGGGTTVM